MIPNKKLKQLAKKYFELHEKLHGKNTQEKREILTNNTSFDEVDDIISIGNTDSIALLSKQCDISDDPAYLENIGAGPLEDFLVYFGEKKQKEIDNLIESSTNAQTALTSVWKIE
ncbi:hypothetical protein JW887_06670 [Candidatus Dojkabacteria bacterium]|nr:hypothetical protein [Candidatus Dojkabacteria bacterium]